jgi:hypothetical protein
MFSPIKCNISLDDNAAKMPVSYHSIFVRIARCILTVVGHEILNESIKAIKFLRTHVGLLLKYMKSGAEITFTQHV